MFYSCRSPKLIKQNNIYIYYIISVILVAQTTGGCGPPPTKQAKQVEVEEGSSSTLFHGPSADQRSKVVEQVAPPMAPSAKHVAGRLEKGVRQKGPLNGGGHASAANHASSGHENNAESELNHMGERFSP